MRILSLIGLLLLLLTSSVQATPLRFSLVRTGESLDSGDYAWRDGRFAEPARITHVAVLIEHRGSRLLFGTGLGRQLDRQVDSLLPWRAKRYRGVTPVRDQLERDGLAIDRIVLGCARWTHASGLADFAGLPVLASAEGIAYAREGVAPAVLAPQFEPAPAWQPLVFEPIARAGFAESVDLFGDGQVVLVKLPGHGALGLLLTLDGGHRYFLRGDSDVGEAVAPASVDGADTLADLQRRGRLAFYPYRYR